MPPSERNEKMVDEASTEGPNKRGSRRFRGLSGVSRVVVDGISESNPIHRWLSQAGIGSTQNSQADPPPTTQGMIGRAHIMASRRERAGAHPPGYTPGPGHHSISGW